MLDRFFVPELLQQPAITLTGTEAQHLSRVLRKQPGEDVTLFDGQGHEARARIDRLDRRTVTLTVSGPAVDRPTAGVQVILATAVPKGDRSRWLVEKATELGAAAWIPLLTQRAVVDPRATRLDKLKQTVITACKQCGRNDLMQIHQPQQWTEFLEQDFGDAPLLVADPTGLPTSDLMQDDSLNSFQSVTVAIGPEGGFTNDELESARNRGARLIQLGESVLRIETAALAALAIIRLPITSAD